MSEARTELRELRSRGAPGAPRSSERGEELIPSRGLQEEPTPPGFCGYLSWSPWRITQDFAWRARRSLV